MSDENIEPQPLPTEPGIYVSPRAGWEQQAPLTLSNYGEWFQYGSPVDPRQVLIPWDGLVRLEPATHLDRDAVEHILYEVAYQADQFMGLMNGLKSYVDRIEKCIQVDEPVSCGRPTDRPGVTKAPPLP